ncbi:MAG: hypothetical protein U5K79_11895 [Cyclobacteriaceae bacterium]|nr:hypothetical protein [Cyclobacteriaceae bacterium]
MYNGTLRYYGYNAYPDELITEYAPRTQNQNLNISGASDKASYYVSFEYIK